MVEEEVEAEVEAEGGAEVAVAVAGPGIFGAPGLGDGAGRKLACLRTHPLRFRRLHLLLRRLAERAGKAQAHTDQ